MDGKGRRIDNVVIERFRHSLKYDELYFNLHDTAWDLERGTAGYIKRYNKWRSHSAFGRRVTPELAYDGNLPSAVGAGGEEALAFWGGMI
jgi:putative transposase